MDSDVEVVNVSLGARPYQSEDMDSDVVIVGDGSAARSSSQGSTQTRLHLPSQSQTQSQSQQQNTTPKPDEPLERLEKALENACQTLYALSTGVHDFSYDNQHVIFAKVNEFVRDLRDIDDCSKHVNAVIPSEVIDAIDKGRNPEWCTYQMLESCAEASNVVRGKLDVVEQFRDELEKSLHQAQEEGTLQMNGDEVLALHDDANPTNGF